METTRLDIQLVDTYKLNTIAFADLSQYQGNISNVSFEVTVPGYSKVNVSFSPRVVNIYNAVNLEITTEDTSVYLPDGVYTVKYSIAPNTTTYIQKSFMRTGYIESLYKRTFLQVDNGCSCDHKTRKELKEKLRDIKLLIDGSIAAADDCNNYDANEMYKRALKQLQNFKLCECA